MYLVGEHSIAGAALTLLAQLNIVLLVVDDVGWDLWNAAEIPNLSSLQEESVTFSRAYSMPTCSPTRYMLQFGQYGRRNPSGSLLYIIMKPDPIDADLDHTSLAHVAKAQGYRTLHAGKWHLSTTANYDHLFAPNLHGYDDALAWTHGNVGIQTPQGAMTPGDYSRWLRNDNGFERIETRYATSVVIDETIAWWSSVPGPKFAHVSLHAPHAPHHAPPAELLPPGVSPGTTQYEHTLAMLSAADTEIGRLFAALDLDDTAVFVMSDNGTTQAISAVPAKFTVHEGGINVPFFVHVPGAVPKISLELVSLVDVQATVADLIGYRGPLGADTLSFAHTLGVRGTTPRRTRLFAEVGNPNGLLSDVKSHQKTVQQGQYRLIVEEKSGVEIFRQVYRLDGTGPFVEVPIVDAEVETRLQLLLDAL